MSSAVGAPSSVELGWPTPLGPRQPQPRRLQTNTVDRPGNRVRDHCELTTEASRLHINPSSALDTHVALPVARRDAAERRSAVMARTARGQSIRLDAARRTRVAGRCRRRKRRRSRTARRRMDRSRATPNRLARVRRQVHRTHKRGKSPSRQLASCASRAADRCVSVRHVGDSGSN